MKLFDCLDLAFSALIPALVLVHLAVAPHTKVEESFNIQATHDVLVYGTPTSRVADRLRATYDHFSFPGAVPRTFVGPVLLAGISQPVIRLVGFRHAQAAVRAVLGLFNAACLLVFAGNLRRAFGPGVARWYLLLQASQFHVVFYASRTLPNMFAFGLTTLAFSFLTPHPDPKAIAPRQRLAITMFVFAAAIFRSEVGLFLAATVVYLLAAPELHLARLVAPFLVAFAAALLISVPVDSYFWQPGAARPAGSGSGSRLPLIWPELSAFYYNAVLGSSSAWGTSPWHYYFLSALPRLLINPLVPTLLLPLAARHPALAPRARRFLVPPLLFVAAYSLQPHKEARFVLYTVPPLTAAAAMAADLVFARRAKGIRPRLLAMGLVFSVLLSAATSCGMLLVSSLNYPGGDALAYLRDSVILPQMASGTAVDGGAAAAATSRSAGSSSTTTTTATTINTVVSVHADVLSCMTGVTRFSVAAGYDSPDPSRPQGWTSQDGPVGGRLSSSSSSASSSAVTIALDKTEDAPTLSRDDFWTRFDYVLAEEHPARIARYSRDEHLMASSSSSASAAAVTAAAAGAEAEDLWEVIGVVKGFAGIELVRPGGGGSGSDDGDDDNELVVGRGAAVATLKRRVRALTGGWWVGPRMVPRVYIYRRVKDSERTRRLVEA